MYRMGQFDVVSTIRYNCKYRLVIGLFVCVCEKTGVNKRNILNKMSNFVKMEIFSNYQKYIDNEQELREVSIIHMMITSINNEYFHRTFA